MSEKELENLYEKYYADTYRFAFSFTHDESSAKDIVSEAWIKIVRHINSKKEVNKSFIFLVLRNTAIDYLRKEKLRVCENIEDKDFKEKIKTENEEDDFEENFDNKIFLQNVLNIIESFGEVEKETLKLKFFSDLKNKEIAAILKVKEKTVSSNLSKALKKIKNILAVK